MSLKKLGYEKEEDINKLSQSQSAMYQVYYFECLVECCRKDPLQQSRANYYQNVIKILRSSNARVSPSLYEQVRNGGVCDMHVFLSWILI